MQNIIVHGESTIEDTSTITFNGVIWKSIKSKSMPVIFIEPSPRVQNVYRNGDNLVVSVQHPFNRMILHVDWFIDGKMVGTDAEYPYHYRLAGLLDGAHTVMVRAMDKDGGVNETAPIRIRIISQ